MKVTRRVRIATYVTAGAVLLIAASPAPPPECEVAKAWVASHRDSLPSTLAAYSTYSPVFRRSIYGNLSWDVRRSLWRAHLTPFTTLDSELRGPQREFVRDVLSKVDIYFDSAGGKQALERDSVEAKARKLFGKDLGRRVFVALGGDWQPTTQYVVKTAGIADGAFFLVRAVATKFGVGGAPQAWCNCSTNSDWCGFYSQCHGGGCDSLEWGCGFGGYYSCTGLCGSAT